MHARATISSPSPVNVNKRRHDKRTLQTLSFDGKVCVVTGAARGLGNMFARTFVESGCTKIVIMDLNQADAERAAQEVEDWFGASRWPRGRRCYCFG